MLASVMSEVIADSIGGPEPAAPRQAGGEPTNPPPASAHPVLDGLCLARVSGPGMARSRRPGPPGRRYEEVSAPPSVSPRPWRSPMRADQPADPHLCRGSRPRGLPPPAPARGALRLHRSATRRGTARPADRGPTRWRRTRTRATARCRCRPTPPVRAPPPRGGRPARGWPRRSALHPSGKGYSWSRRRRVARPVQRGRPGGARASPIPVPRASVRCHAVATRNASAT